MGAYENAPAELQVAISEFFPQDEWDNAAAISRLESGWNAFAVNDTRRPDAPCGEVVDFRDGVRITAEYSIGYFQINACNLPAGWVPEHLFNARHNVGTAHDLFDRAGASWRPWYFSAKKLGLIS